MLALLQVPSCVLRLIANQCPVVVDRFAWSTAQTAPAGDLLAKKKIISQAVLTKNILAHLAQLSVPLAKEHCSGHTTLVGIGTHLVVEQFVKHRKDHNQR